jgi:hypothetical protein
VERHAEATPATVPSASMNDSRLIARTLGVSFHPLALALSGKPHIVGFGELTVGPYVIRDDPANRRASRTVW